MSKTITWIIIIILILIGAWYFFMRDTSQEVLNTNTSTDTGANTSTNTNTTGINAGVTVTVPQPKNVTVTYTSSGFSPKTVTIKQGDSVTFVNESNGGMSVASNPHPSHTIYPEFDQYKSSERNSSRYTMTFGKVGSWGYHNHYNPSLGGTVIVQ